MHVSRESLCSNNRKIIEMRKSIILGLFKPCHCHYVLIVPIRWRYNYVNLNLNVYFSKKQSVQCFLESAGIDNRYKAVESTR